MQKNRLENLREKINSIIYEKQPDRADYFFSHIYGVSKFCALLATRRNLNAELASTAGMLHDIYQITHDEIENHAEEGAKVAEQILRDMKLYSEDEILKITTAISKHSKKRKVHEPFDELLKDADVLDHCMYNPDFSVLEKEVERYKNLLMELGCNVAE
jgi:putative nucleotidyltransferase with HDIG domain